MSTGTDTVDEEAPAVETDAVREAIATAFAEHLGDRFLEQHIRPGRDLWIRIDRSGWVDAARLGCTCASYGARTLARNGVMIGPGSIRITSTPAPAISNSFGFGGHNATLVFGPAPE